MSSPETPPPGRAPPPNVVVFGPNANCTFELCSIKMSVYRYQPSIPANATFIALYAIAFMIHTYLGVRWRRWWFTVCINLGCLNAIIGYAARIMLHNNPWSFVAFMIQIVCVTTGPVYYCAAIYITLALSIQTLSPAHSRFKPTLFYWIFLPCDMVSLVLQAAGGANSTSTAGQGKIGVDLAIAGMAFQVFTLLMFCAFMGDYLVRYFKAYSRGEVSVQAAQSGSASRSLGGVKGAGMERVKLFFGFLSLAIVLTLVRCIFRLVELNEGYSGHLVADEGLFIGLEGVVIVIVVYALMVGHPGFVFEREGKTAVAEGTDTEVSEAKTGR